MALISVIIPAFNEENNLEILAKNVISVFQNLPHTFEIIVVNDGSSDDTEQKIRQLSLKLSNVYYLNFSRNFGQQSALKAGYDHSNGDAVICMDADLQNPPEIITEMIAQWELGYEIVLCKRKDANQNGSFLKEISSRGFYRIIRFLSDIPIEKNAPDFRLLDRKLVDIIKRLPEKEMFLRGMISWMGFSKTVVEYSHGTRLSGKTNYSFGKMMALAATGITSFSVRPLHLAIYMGLFISGLSLLYIPYVFFQYYQGHTISGWSSLIVTVSFLGGLQLFILGIIGLYLGKMVLQVKQRPDYIVKSTNL
jgi:glycosyltransferase involved in cell wall biosynthesis